MDVRRIFGNSAERQAATFLKKKGYTILEQQYRTRFGEIDLIALDGDEIVFVEVKARKGSAFGFPEESVTQKKLKKIILVGEAYIKQREKDAPYRIDVISLLQTKNEMQVTHLESVFLDD